MSAPAPARGTVASLLAEATERLRLAGVPTPAVDARWIVEATLGSEVSRGPDRVPAAAEVAALESALARRARREPLQLVLGSAAFHDIAVACRPGVFVPRPETEVLVEHALAALARRAAPGRTLRVVEPCTGSGAVALSLAAARGDVTVVASDVDPVAVTAAEDNRAALSADGTLRGSVDVRQGPLLDPVDPAWRGTIDLVVANPPYLPAGEAGEWEPEVRDHDPRAALVGGPDGHEVVDALIAAAVAWLAPGGALLVEIDARRAADARSVATRAGLVEVTTHRDLTGRERVLAAMARPADGKGPA